MRFLSAAVLVALAGCATDADLTADLEAEAIRAAKADVCHWSDDDEQYVQINVSLGSAHFDASKHPEDVLPGAYYTDADLDGYGDAGATATECPEGLDGYADNADDCDDGAASTNPGADEACGDGVDNDCDGEVDEGCVVGITNPVSSRGYNFEWSNGGRTYAGGADAICREYGYTTAGYFELCGQDASTAGYPNCAFTRCEMWYRPGGWVVGNCDNVSYGAVTYIECQ